MKKVLIGILFVGMTVSALSAQEQRIREHTEKLQKGKYGWGLVGAAAGGAAAGGIAGGYIGVKTNPPEGDVGFGLIPPIAGGITGTGLGVIGGTALAIAYRLGLQNWQLRKINVAIKKYTLLSRFQKLPVEQAMLFVAAYKRHVPVMQALIQRQSEFVDQKGVWKALTNLFYNQKPTSIQVERLKNMLKKE